MTGVKKYERSRKTVETAINEQKKKELESALADFEALLITEQVKKKEKEFIKTAHIEVQKLQISESIFFFGSAFPMFFNMKIPKFTNTL